jgi:hypothetical protein
VFEIEDDEAFEELCSFLLEMDSDRVLDEYSTTALTNVVISLLNYINLNLHKTDLQLKFAQSMKNLIEDENKLVQLTINEIPLFFEFLVTLLETDPLKSF